MILCALCIHLANWTMWDSTYHFSNSNCFLGELWPIPPVNNYIVSILLGNGNGLTWPSQGKQVQQNQIKLTSSELPPESVTRCNSYSFFWSNNNKQCLAVWICPKCQAFITFLRSWSKIWERTKRTDSGVGWRGKEVKGCFSNVDLGRMFPSNSKQFLELKQPKNAV